MALTSLRRSLAVLSALAVLAPCLSAALAPAQLRGRVMQADGRTPRTGVTVVLVDEAGNARYRSQPTSARGVFRIQAAQAGSYRLLTETPEGAFLAVTPVSLKPGDSRALSLSLTPAEQEPAPPEPEPEPAPPTEPPAPPPAAPTAPPSVDNGPNWRKWVIVGGIGVAALLVIGEMSDEDKASPF